MAARHLQLQDAAGGRFSAENSTGAGQLKQPEAYQILAGAKGKLHLTIACAVLGQACRRVQQAAPASPVLIAHKPCKGQQKAKHDQFPGATDLTG